MGRPQDLFNKLHQLIEQHENRGVIARLAAVGHLPRPFSQVARSIVQDRGGRIGIVTGFYVPGAVPPKPETDGPIGAAQLAHFLHLGGWDVALITDAFCQTALSRCREIVGGTYPITVLSDAAGVDAKLKAWRKDNAVPGHLIAIERAGPNRSGQIINIAGDDITSFTPPLHRLFQHRDDGKPLTISLADGLNEIGAETVRNAMLAVSPDLDQARLCAVAVDHLVLGCTANIGAAGLAAALAIEDPDLIENLKTSFRTELSDLLMDRLADEEIAVDGVKRTFSSRTVDGIDAQLLNNVVQALVQTATTRSILQNAE